MIVARWIEFMDDALQSVRRSFSLAHSLIAYEQFSGVFLHHCLELLDALLLSQRDRGVPYSSSLLQLLWLGLWKLGVIMGELRKLGHLTEVTAGRSGHFVDLFFRFALGRGCRAVGRRMAREGQVLIDHLVGEPVNVAALL